MSRKGQVQEFAAGEVSLWIEQGSSIHLKAVSSQGDPVELTASEALQIADALLEVAKLLKSSDDPE